MLSNGLRFILWLGALLCCSNRVTSLVYSITTILPPIRHPSSLFSLKRSKIVHSQPLSDNGDDASYHHQLRRRDAAAYILGSAWASLTAMLTFPSYASAAQGAAEYDLEFYLRDLFQGNNREGNIQPSNPPIPLPPRTLNTKEVLELLINEHCDGHCFSVALLSQLTGVPSDDISNRVALMRQRVCKAFQAKAPWIRESIQDQYYLDLTAYCLFRVAAQLIPTDYTLRDKWIRTLGKQLYAQAKKRHLITPTNNETRTLSASVPTLIQLMDFFNSTRYVSSYRIIQSDSVTATDFLDTLDDEDIQDGRPVNLLISLLRPATLGAALQLTAEGTRFSPEFVAPTLAAMWEEQFHLSTQYETYFVDNTYRANPKDFFPDEVLIQFTIQRKTETT